MRRATSKRARPRSARPRDAEVAGWAVEYRSVSSPALAPISYLRDDGRARVFVTSSGWKVQRMTPRPITTLPSIDLTSAAAMAAADLVIRRR